MAGMVPLQLQGISKSYGAVQALRPVFLDVKPGEMVALLGPSGCGKTTSLRIIAGFEMPDTGSVLIGGSDVTELAPNRRGLGMVFQNYSLFPHMNVAENVGFGLRMQRISAADRQIKVTQMLDLVRLGHVADRSIHQLSGGQQQRIALARALVTNPSVLLLDEPLGALDKNLREGMQFELRELQRRIGITSILVTHDQEEALTMSDRVAVMAAGTIVQIGPPTEIYNAPRNRFVSEFLGTSNIFVGTVMGEGGANLWRVSLRSGAAVIEITGNGVPPVGRRVMFAVRPERMIIGDPVASPLKATLRDAVFRGSYYACELDLQGQDTPIIVYSRVQPEVGSGSLVGLSWPGNFAVPLEDAA